jgi:type I restriction-modification system DNA methylase subunit
MLRRNKIIMTPAAIVSKLWNYCNVLRDDGMSYLLARCTQASGDYVEQLTYLLFLKMADERTNRRATRRATRRARCRKSTVGVP